MLMAIDVLRWKSTDAEVLSPQVQEYCLHYIGKLIKSFSIQWVGSQLGTNLRLNLVYLFNGRIEFYAPFTLLHGPFPPTQYYNGLNQPPKYEISVYERHFPIIITLYRLEFILCVRRALVIICIACLVFPVCVVPPSSSRRTFRKYLLLILYIQPLLHFNGFPPSKMNQQRMYIVSEILLKHFQFSNISFYSYLQNFVTIYVSQQQTLRSLLIRASDDCFI